MNEKETRSMCTVEKQIVECSSIYAIDYAAVIFSVLDGDKYEYELYLNDVADVKSEFRKYISRLSLPTLKYEIDPQGNLRQVHIPIEDVTPMEFLDAVKEACRSYSLLDTGNIFKLNVIDRLELEIENFSLHTSLDCYKRLIEIIIEAVCGIEISVARFGGIRNGYNVEICKLFWNDILSNIGKLNDGKYKFIKGGRIEFFENEQWIGVKQFIKNNGGIVFRTSDGKLYDSSEIDSSENIRYRGPLETILLSYFGQLIDFPWYLGGEVSFSPQSDWGIEYISPISTSSIERTSKKIKGNGMRLIPSGYSLIDYSSNRVLDLIGNIYNENCQISEADLTSWKEIVNNYPVTSQKLAKSQTSVHALCNAILNERFLNANFSEMVRIQYKNYVKLGDDLANSCILAKILRLLNTEKSPYFGSKKWNNWFYISEEGVSLDLLILDLLEIIDRLIALQTNEAEISRYKIIDEEVYSKVRHELEDEKTKKQKNKGVR